MLFTRLRRHLRCMLRGECTLGISKIRRLGLLLGANFCSEDML